ncbi:hypothetical protein DKX38_000256 [Salix brachista]|uniref:Uncharacterized protein n=1 Tax=Salix brachista TaxID=2182728 RepID=A0A5N5P0J3_9ROSI|nr:hypothetical protein DKX38_000256 [Salix brachista]
MCGEGRNSKVFLTRYGSRTGPTGILWFKLINQVNYIYIYIYIYDRMDGCVLSEHAAFSVLVAIVIKVLFSFRGAQNSISEMLSCPSISISLNIILPTNIPSMEKVRGDGTYGTRRINNKHSAEEKESEGLAGLKSIAVGVVGGLSRRRKAKTKKIKVEDELMDLWHKMIFPVRRVWLAVSARLKARKNGLSLLSFFFLLSLYFLS